MGRVDVKEHLELLGKRAEDKITGFQGVVASISFDLYGCVQAILNPGVDKNGKLQDQTWFDVNRLKLLGTARVMEPPEFELAVQKGPAEKPQFYKA